jgi:hypothetical protein
MQRAEQFIIMRRKPVDVRDEYRHGHDDGHGMTMVMG